MPKFRIELSGQAWQDLDQIFDYYSAMQGALSAQLMTEKILDEIEAQSLFPYSAPLHPDPKLAATGYRKLVLTRTYVAIYKVVDSTVYIYRYDNVRTDYPNLLQ